MTLVNLSRKPANLAFALIHVKVAMCAEAVEPCSRPRINLNHLCVHKFALFVSWALANESIS